MECLYVQSGKKSNTLCCSWVFCLCLDAMLHIRKNVFILTNNFIQKMTEYTDVFCLLNFQHAFTLSNIMFNSTVLYRHISKSGNLTVTSDPNYFR